MEERREMASSTTARVMSIVRRIVCVLGVGLSALWGASRSTWGLLVGVWEEAWKGGGGTAGVVPGFVGEGLWVAVGVREALYEAVRGITASGRH